MSKRAIKFRGLRADGGGWVFSISIDQCNDGRVYLKIYSKAEDNQPWFGWVEVKPETVGQFTGLLDKNGKEIYEGDIVLDHYKKPCVVKWDTDLGSCGCCYDEFRGAGFINCHTAFEVIGNIHE